MSSKPRLFVNDVEVDLGQKQKSIALTMRSAPLGDLKTRSVNNLNTFEAPLTEANVALLGNIVDENSISDIPYKRQSARVVQDGCVLQDGDLLIERITNVFKLNVQSGAAVFFDIIKELTLQNLTFVGAGNGTWYGASGVPAPNTSSGMAPIVIDYGRFNISGGFGNVHDATFLPSVWYHSVILAIVNQAGYSLDLSACGALNVIATSEFYKMVIPFSRDSWKYGSEFIKTWTLIASKNVTQSFAGLGGGGGNYITFPNEGQDISNSFNGTTYQPVFSTSLATGTMFLWSTVEITAEITVTSSSVIVELWDNTSGVVVTTLTAGIGSGTLNVISAPVQLANNRDYRIRIRSAGGIIATVNVLNGLLKIIPTGEPHLNYVIVNEILPDMSQMDLMKDFALRFGILFKEKNKVLYCKTINNVLTETHNAKDWTSKRVKDTPRNTQFVPLTYSKSNTFTYEVGDDFSLGFKALGDASMDIDNDNIETEAPFYECPFCYTANRKTAEYDLAYIPIFDTSVVRTTFDNGCGLRLVMTRTKRGYERNITINGSTGGLYYIGYFDDAQELYSMHWSHFLNKFYPLITAALQRAKLVDHQYILNGNDIEEFDFFTMVFDKDSMYLVDEIKDYIDQLPTKVRLLKI